MSGFSFFKGFFKKVLDQVSADDQDKVETPPIPPPTAGEGSSKTGATEGGACPETNQEGQARILPFSGTGYRLGGDVVEHAQEEQPENEPQEGEGDPNADENSDASYAISPDVSAGEEADGELVDPDELWSKTYKGLRVKHEKLIQKVVDEEIAKATEINVKNEMEIMQAVMKRTAELFSEQMQHWTRATGSDEHAGKNRRFLQRVRVAISDYMNKVMVKTGGIDLTDLMPRRRANDTSELIVVVMMNICVTNVENAYFNLGYMLAIKDHLLPHHENYEVYTPMTGPRESVGLPISLTATVGQLLVAARDGHKVAQDIMQKLNKGCSVIRDEASFSVFEEYLRRETTPAEFRDMLCMLPNGGNPENTRMFLNRVYTEVEQDRKERALKEFEFLISKDMEKLIEEPLDFDIADEWLEGTRGVKKGDYSKKRKCVFDDYVRSGYICLETMSIPGFVEDEEKTEKFLTFLKDLLFEIDSKVDMERFATLSRLHPKCCLDGFLSAFKAKAGDAMEQDEGQGR